MSCLTEVICKREECIHFQRKDADKVLCAHKEKKNYMKTWPCPLYQMDFSKEVAMKMPNAQAAPVDFLKVFQRRQS